MISSATQTSIEPALQAKLVAERFIETFSAPGSPSHWAASHNIELLSQEDRETFKKILTSEVVCSLKRGDIPEETSFYVVGQGHHFWVLGHTSYPKIVIKLMNLEDAQAQQRVAEITLEVAQEINNCWIQVPISSFIYLGKITAYLEERLPIGLSMSQHKEFWARILTHYQSSKCTELFKTNLHQLIDQIQLIIMRVGFWDVEYHNLPEIRIDGTGVCATDFEKINLDEEDDRAFGFENLAMMVPISPLVDSIIAGNKRQLSLVNALFDLKMRHHEQFQAPKPTLEKIQLELDADLEEKKESLAALQEAIRFYDQGREISSSCDFSSFDEQEKVLAEKLLSALVKKQSENRTPDRCLREQPGCYYKSQHYTRERFLKVLHVLKQQNVIAAWSDDYTFKQSTDRDTHYASYTIYC